VSAGYSKFGLNCGMFSMSWLGMQFIRSAERAVESCRRPDTRATARAHVGTAHYFAGRLDEAEAALRESVGTLDKVGDWFGMFSHHVLRHIAAVRGDNSGELAEAEIEIAIGTARGDMETLCWGQYGKANALARAGRIDEAQELTARAVLLGTDRDSNLLGIALGTLGFVRLQASNYSGARDALERSRSQLFRKLFVIEFSGPTFPLLVESLLGPRWADAEGRPKRPVARQAWRDSRFARFIGWRYPNYHPHALRVSGRAAYALGKQKAASRYLEQAIVAAEKLGARYDLARALLDASLVIPDRADDYRRRGQQLLDDLGAVVPEAERLPS